MGKTINRGTSGLSPIKGSNGVHKPNTAKVPTSAMAKAEMPNSGKIALGTLSCSEGGKSC